MNEILVRIRKVFDSIDKSQTEIGKKINKTPQYVWKLLNDDNVNPSGSVINDICREFAVNEEWLRTGEGEMFEELTEQQKLLKYTGLLLKDKDSTVANAIQTLIITYEQLDAPSKATLEKIALQYINNLKKSQ